MDLCESHTHTHTHILVRFANNIQTPLIVNTFHLFSYRTKDNCTNLSSIMIKCIHLHIHLNNQHYKGRFFASYVCFFTILFHFILSYNSRFSLVRALISAARISQPYINDCVVLILNNYCFYSNKCGGCFKLMDLKQLRLLRRCLFSTFLKESLLSVSKVIIYIYGICHTPLSRVIHFYTPFFKG